MNEQERRQAQARKKRMEAKREAERKAKEKKIMTIAIASSVVIIAIVAVIAIMVGKQIKKRVDNSVENQMQAQTINSDQTAPSLDTSDDVTYVEHGMSVAKYVSCKSGINIRKAPSTDAAIIGGAGYGEKVEVIAELYDGEVATGWYKTVAGAYVYGGNLSDAHPETQNTAAQEQAQANNQTAAQTTQPANTQQTAQQTTQSADTQQTTQQPAQQQNTQNTQNQKESPAPYYGTCVYPRVDVHLFNQDGTERTWCSLNTDGLYYNSKSESFKDNGDGTFTDKNGTVYKVGK